jgi:hypothetical protein
MKTCWSSRPQSTSRSSTSVRMRHNRSTLRWCAHACCRALAGPCMSLRVHDCLRVQGAAVTTDGLGSSPVLLERPGFGKRLYLAPEVSLWRVLAAACRLIYFSKAPQALALLPPSFTLAPVGPFVCATALLVVFRPLCHRSCFSWPCPTPCAADVYKTAREWVLRRLLGFGCHAVDNGCAK